MQIRVREVFLKKTLTIFFIANCILMGISPILLLFWKAAMTSVLKTEINSMAVSYDGSFFFNFKLKIWAIVTIGYSTMEGDNQNKKWNFIREQTVYDQIGLKSLVGGSSMLITGCLIGMLRSFFHLPLIFNSYRSILACSIALKIFAVFWITMIHPSFHATNNTEILKSFEMESIHFHEKTTLGSIWKKTVIFWSEMQSQLTCCGVHDFQDWIYSSCNSVPPSCCIPAKQSQCERIISNPLGPGTPGLTIGQLNDIKKVIWEKDCSTALTTGLFELRDFFSACGFSVIFMELIIFTICIHILKLLEHHVKKIKRKENYDNNGKFGVWLLEPSDLIFKGTGAGVGNTVKQNI